MGTRKLEIRANLENVYSDVYTKEAVAALEALVAFDADRKAVMQARIERRAARAREKRRITFLDPESTIPRTKIKVRVQVRHRRSGFPECPVIREHGRLILD